MSKIVLALIAGAGIAASTAGPLLAQTVQQPLGRLQPQQLQPQQLPPRQFPQTLTTPSPQSQTQQRIQSLQQQQLQRLEQQRSRGLGRMR